MKGNNTIHIGGELESVATGGVVVSADGIKDYQLNKLQEDINLDSALSLNRAYDTTSFSGLGKRTLRKNVVSNKNVLTQAMMSDAHTVYVIQYDYTLGENVTVPAGCTLIFDGGSINNVSGASYELIGTNTAIEAGLVRIFGNNLSFGGTWRGSCYVDWFGAKRYSIPTQDDCSSAIQAALDSPFGEVRFTNGYYYVAQTMTITKRKNIVMRGGDMEGIITYFNRTNISDGNRTTIMWSDKDIDILHIEMSEAQGIGGNPDLLYICNGTIDVTKVAGYSHDVIKVYRQPYVNLHPMFSVNVIGPNTNVPIVDSEGTHCVSCTGRGLVITEYGSNDGGSVYGGLVKGVYARLGTAISHDMTPDGQGGVYVTNFIYDAFVNVCKYAYDFGDSGNRGGSIGGWVQPGTYYGSVENGESLIKGDISLCYINSFLWDTGLQKNEGCTTQYSIIIPDRYGLQRLQIGERVRRYSIGGDLAAFGIAESCRADYLPNGYVAKSNESNFVKLLDNNLYFWPNVGITASGCTHNATYGTNNPNLFGEGVVITGITENDASIVFDVTNLTSNTGTLVRLYVTEYIMANIKYFTKITTVGYKNSVAKQTIEKTIVFDNTGVATQKRLLFEFTEDFDEFTVTFSNPSNTGNSGQFRIKAEAQMSISGYEHLFTRREITIPSGRILTVNGREYLYGAMTLYSGSSMTVNSGSQLTLKDGIWFDTKKTKVDATTQQLFVLNSGKWYNQDGVDMTGVTAVKGDNDTREAMNLTIANEGLRYYDTYLKKYVLWNGTTWTNLDGTSLT